MEHVFMGEFLRNCLRSSSRQLAKGGQRHREKYLQDHPKNFKIHDFFCRSVIYREGSTSKVEKEF